MSFERVTAATAAEKKLEKKKSFNVLHCVPHLKPPTNVKIMHAFCQVSADLV